MTNQMLFEPFGFRFNSAPFETLQLKTSALSKGLVVLNFGPKCFTLIFQVSNLAGPIKGPIKECLQISKDIKFQ